MLRSGILPRSLAVAVLAAALALVVVAQGAAGAQGYGNGERTARIEVRVLQDVVDELDIYVSARAAVGSWRTLGNIPLPLDDGFSADGRYRFGDIALEVPFLDQASTVTVEVRVWQHVFDSARVHISARPAYGSWDTLGTKRLLLDDGFSSTTGRRFGDIALDVSLPATGVITLAGKAGFYGHEDGRGSEAMTVVESPLAGWPSITMAASSSPTSATRRFAASCPTEPSPRSPVETGSDSGMAPWKPCSSGVPPTSPSIRRARSTWPTARATFARSPTAW